MSVFSGSFDYICYLHWTFGKKCGLFSTSIPLVNTFLSPARRGRGILVVQGFCPASRFLVGAKNLKTTGQI